MQIISARYVNEQEESVEVTPLEVKAHLYESVYRGNLFCTTKDCDARIVYVHRVGNSSYFRTWKRDDHATHCLHYFERGATRVGSKADEVINVEISPQKKKKKLEEAYAQVKSDPNQKINIGRNRRTKSNPTTDGKERVVQLQLVLFDGEAEEVIKEKGFRAPPLYKRDVNVLRELDIGKIRVVNGIITDVDYDESSAQIKIEREGVQAVVRFGEAFFASSPNYTGLFHHIRRYIAENEDVIFIGIGEVQMRNGCFEIFIFNGEEFTIQNTGLLTLAQMYASGLWG